MTKKTQLRHLILNYMKGNYDISTFCSEFERIYYHVENDSDSISNAEADCFKKIASFASRYSNHKVDISRFPNVYTSEKDIKEQIDVYINKGFIEY